jgi:hypothetical protein
MINRKRAGFIIVFFMVVFSLSAVTIASAVNAVVVSEVKDLGDYVPRNHSFTHGDLLTVYVEMQDVNHYGFVSVDFFFIIEDAKGQVVATDTLNVNRENYCACSDYVAYTKRIGDWWLDGKYELGIYAYDRVDDAKTRETVKKIEVNRSTPEKLIEEDEFSLGGVVTESLTDSRKEKRTIIFFVHPEVIKELEEPPGITPPPPLLKPAEVKKPEFTVMDFSIDKFEVKSDERVSISVTVKNTGSEGKGKVSVLINEKKEAEEAATLSEMESRTFIFIVHKDRPGQYKVTVPGSDIVRQFFVNESREGTGNTSLSAPVSVTGMQQLEKGKKEGFGAINLFAAAFILLLVIILLHLRFYSRLRLLWK